MSRTPANLHPGLVVQLQQTIWTLREMRGEGASGPVFAADGDGGSVAALKFVQRRWFAKREQEMAEFLRLESLDHVVPVKDIGEEGDYLVIAMPLARESLLDRLQGSGSGLGVDEARHVLRDVATGLVAMMTASQPIIHRDLKPGNILMLDGAWQIADLGISRFIDASTSTNTFLGGGTEPYKPPEAWRYEPHNDRSDIYSLGAVIFHVVTGSPPFTGADLKDKHLSASAPRLHDVPPGLANLVARMLSKSSDSRPSAVEVLASAIRMAETDEGSPGLAKLIRANDDLATANAATADAELRSQEVDERRIDMVREAGRQLNSVLDQMTAHLRAHIDLATVQRASGISDRLDIEFGGATLSFESVWRVNDWSGPFDVVAQSLIRLSLPRPLADGYEGRQHALWFGDLCAQGEYTWFDIAFWRPQMAADDQRPQMPFAHEPIGEAVDLFSGRETVMDLACFEQLDVEAPERFIDRWLGWLAEASTGELVRPGALPGHSVERCWRRDGITTSAPSRGL